MKITGGTLIATAGDATYNSYGLMVDNSGVLEIMGGTVKATGGKATSYASEGIFVNGGSGTLNLSGGECWATSSQGDVSYAFRCQGNINISGGILHVSSGYTATASNSQGIRATDSEGKITITGGMIAASSCDGGDTIYSNGTITVSHELITENHDTGYDTTSNSTDFTSGTTQTLKQSDYSKPLKIGKVGHMVAYDENGVTGGAAPSDDTVYANNAQVTVAGNTLNMYKTGYKFDKWNTKADGTGADYVPGTTFNITDDTTLYAQWKELEQLEYTVTFKVVNGSWDDDTAGDKTVTLSGLEGDVLKLSAEQIPAVGSKPNDTYKAGSWDTTPSAETEITADTTYTYTYAQKDSISQTVTFKVVNGSWNDETTTDKTVTLTGYEGDTLKLVADQIPTVGTKPNDTYKAGSWDVTPSTETEITAATTYTYIYAQKDAISQTVTFKVVNGSWNDETTTDKTVTLTGYEGDTLKLVADQIPTVGTKPNDTYKAGSWDVTPSTETEITAATTYTYTYAQKDAATVTKAPEAKTLTYTGSAQSLVTAGTAAGGEMRYALGNETRATQPYTTSIPTVINAGTYYVWYKVVGDENHTDTNPVCITVDIGTKTDVSAEQKQGETLTYDGTAKTPTIDIKDGETEVSTYTVKYVGVEPTVYEESETAPTEAGNYKAVITLNGNYSGTKEVPFIIDKKAAPTLTDDQKPTAKNNLSYKGEPQEIVNAPIELPDDYIGIQYAIGSETGPTGEYTTFIPEATDAGTYFVWYKLIGDENHKDTEPVYITVTIKQADLSVKTEVNTSEDASYIKVDNLNDDLAVKLLTDEEKRKYEVGNPVIVYLDITALDKADVPAEDMTAIEKILNSDGYSYGECLDLSLWKKLGEGVPTQIHDTNGNPINITITIPESLKNVPEGYTRTYAVVRLHNGIATKLAEGTGATLEISTDKFSSYFIIFKDVKNSADDKKQDKSSNADTPSNVDTPATVDTPKTADTQKTDAPKTENTNKGNKISTGDKINIGVIVMLMMDSVMAGVYLTLRRKLM